MIKKKILIVPFKRTSSTSRVFSPPPLPSSIEFHRDPCIVSSFRSSLLSDAAACTCVVARFSLTDDGLHPEDTVGADSQSDSGVINCYRINDAPAQPTAEVRSWHRFGLVRAPSTHSCGTQDWPPTDYHQHIAIIIALIFTISRYDESVFKLTQRISNI